MLTESLKSIVNEYRQKGIPVSDSLAEELETFCWRKMDICQIEDKEDYLPLLFRDTVKEYFMRHAINAKTMLWQMESKAV